MMAMSEKKKFPKSGQKRQGLSAGLIGEDGCILRETVWTLTLGNFTGVGRDRVGDLAVPSSIGVPASSACVVDVNFHANTKVRGQSNVLRAIGT
jgi:hypothetical protein